MSTTLNYMTVILYTTDAPPKTFKGVISIAQLGDKLMLDTRFGPADFENVVKLEVLPTPEPVPALTIELADGFGINVDALMLERTPHAAAEVSRVPTSQGPVAAGTADRDRGE